LVKKGAAFAASIYYVYCMKNGIILIASITFITACNSSGSTDPDLSDSLGNKRTDTTSRSDTGYYERLQQKTSAGDTSQINNPRRNDTGYYERLPNKSNPPDSTH
jgi:hypothetical protein